MRRTNRIFGTNNPSWLLVAFGIVLIWLGVALFFLADPSGDVHGVPNRIYGFVTGAVGTICLAVGLVDLLRRRSS